MISLQLPLFNTLSLSLSIYLSLSVSLSPDIFFCSYIFSGVPHKSLLLCKHDVNSMEIIIYTYI